MSHADVPADAMPHPRRSRWFASWKLWMLLLFVGLALIAAAVCIPTLQRMAALQYLNDHDVHVEIQEGDEWLTDRFGEFGTARRSVRRIVCNGPLNDRVLHAISQLNEVREFETSDHISEPLTGSGVAAFQSLRNLEGLSIRGMVEVPGDEDLISGLLAARPPLKAFAVENTPVSAAAFRELGTFKDLLWVGAVTREDFPGLQSLPNLQEFYLDFSGEIDLNWLQESPQLYLLVLKGPLFDDHLRQIADLKGLNYLSIAPSDFGGDITDAGIEHLTELNDLRSIRLPAELITPATVDLLRRLPRLGEVVLLGPVPIDRNLKQSMRNHWQVSQLLNGY